MTETKKERRKRRRTEAKADRLTAMAIAVAKRRKSNGKKPVKNADELRKLKVPTTPRWKRFAVGTLGAVTLGLGIFGALSGESNGTVAAIFMIPGGLLILGIAIYGNRKSLDEACRSMDVSLTNSMLDGIFDSLF